MNFLGELILEFIKDLLEGLFRWIWNFLFPKRRRNKPAKKCQKAAKETVSTQVSKPKSRSFSKPLLTLSYLSRAIIFFLLFIYYGVLIRFWHRAEEVAQLHKIFEKANKYDAYLMLNIIGIGTYFLLHKYKPDATRTVKKEVTEFGVVLALSLAQSTTILQSGGGLYLQAALNLLFFVVNVLALYPHAWRQATPTPATTTEMQTLPELPKSEVTPPSPRQQQRNS